MMFSSSPEERIFGTIARKYIKIAFLHFVLYKSAFSNILVFLTGEHSNNKNLLISVPYFSSLRYMPIFILVGKLVLLVCIKSALIMSLPARTINKTPLNRLHRKD